MYLIIGTEQHTHQAIAQPGDGECQKERKK